MPSCLTKRTGRVAGANAVTQKRTICSLNPWPLARSCRDRRPKGSRTHFGRSGCWCGEFSTPKSGDSGPERPCSEPARPDLHSIFCILGRNGRGRGHSGGYFCLRLAVVGAGLQNKVATDAAGSPGLQNELMPDSRKRWASWLSERFTKASIPAGAASEVGAGLGVGNLSAICSWMVRTFCRLRSSASERRRIRCDWTLARSTDFCCFSVRSSIMGSKFMSAIEEKFSSTRRQRLTPPGGSHDFGGKGLFDGVSGGEFIH